MSGVPVNLSGQNGLLATEIGKETKFTVEGAIREEGRNVTAPFKQYVQNEVRDGNNPDSTLHPRDDNFRIVMIRSVLRAQKFEMSVGGTSASDPEHCGASKHRDTRGGDRIHPRARRGTN